MTLVDPLKRASLTEVKESEWFNGPVYDHEELKKVMSEKLANVKND